MPDGLVDKVYNLWNRNPVQVSATYLTLGRQERSAGQAQPGQLLGREDRHDASQPPLPSPPPSAASRCTGAVLPAHRRSAAAPPAPMPGQNIEVKLCDNQTTTSVPADQPATRENGEKIAKALMDQWMRANPDAKAWMEEERTKHTIVEPADNSGLVGRGQGAIYGADHRRRTSRRGRRRR